ncbi:alkylated DNA repair protein alkB homolog 8 isoform X2 [Myiozetetes cayanensis]|nr:alkylated DNA repair protein alkB homolog 8 isoform X2 [Myiozetetes cayanensis]XP_050189577.1 alkylated DNA repair protein alkB homolog 8 isoform X2 [Myiozetetes cayanensis]XP_050189578.1 alkylated DNA repair protein alkB homolog 8 isoform X2 [Myiozetetes cayanensis]XP_050189579.1 alkylated DNA repair protein alkB homolog 8 isoform X2 [Myiozetetes cayanensis]XP_050189580.1 alkylated DNA repair protein alkB homolog 8 isoform X2 [Myiozetetes cayanensis]
MEAKTSGDRLKVHKMKKKVLRKQIRAQHTLMRHEGIECISCATQSLVIANAGLGNGMSRHQLLRIVEEYGEVETLLMPPNKPYSFVKYERTEEAKKAFDALNGKEVTLEDCGQNIVLYINFVEKVSLQNAVPTSLPPGLTVIEKIISPEEERRMLESIEWIGDEDTQSAQKNLKHRRVKHFGYEFRYDNNNVDKDKPLPGGLPEICNLFLEKCLKQGYIKHKPDQLTVNQYEPGQGIPPHIDTHSAFEDEIISLSLGAEIVMDFKHPDGHTVAILLPRCSLLVMTGESRYLWTHGITPRKYDIIQASELGQKVGTITADVGDITLNRRETRTSFTFRKVRRSPCNCIYPSVCDSQKGRQRLVQPSFPHNEMEASKLEQEYVHKVYEEIATHFSSTRHSPWPRIVEFLTSLPTGSIVADIGCGNGKYLGISEDLYMVGCDRSKNLVDICGEKHFQAFVCDALSVPMRSGSCDACISIAVIHHFSTAERRLATIRELARLLRPGGMALIYVWAMEQEYKNQKSKYLKEKNGSKGKEKEINTGTTQRLLTDQVPGSSNQDSACFDQLINDLQIEGCDARTVGADFRLPVHTNRTSFQSQDLLVPWHLKGGTKKKEEGVDTVLVPADSKESQKLSPVFHRYYHVFCEGELEAVCKSLDCVRVQKSYYDQGNWCVILEKL